MYRQYNLNNVIDNLIEARMNDDFNLLHCMMHRGATREELIVMFKYLIAKYDTSNGNKDIEEYRKKYGKGEN